MLLKLGILEVILIIGGIVFSGEIQEFFPNTNTKGVNSIKSNVKILHQNQLNLMKIKLNYQ